MFAFLVIPALLVTLFILGLAVFLQNRRIADLEKELESSNAVATKYINFYTEEFDARTSLLKERAAYKTEVARLEKILASRNEELKRLSISKFKKLDTKRVASTTKKKKRA